MSAVKLEVMYGHLEGTAGKFARDPSGYLSITAGIFRNHGLDVSWTHVQGTEERYRRLESGRAQVSLVVGRASLQHFLDSRATRILGCAMNRCPYYLMVEPSVKQLKDLKGKVVACREAPSRNAPLAQTLQARAQLRLSEDLKLQLPNSDQDAFTLLVGGKVQAALLPRPFGFWAEEKGFKRISDWPEVVDDPLPITIETTQRLLNERGKEFEAFLAAHREGLHYLKTHRQEAIRMLEKQFEHSPTFAAKTFDDYLVCMDTHLKVDFKQLEKLLGQVAPATPGGARQVAADWIAPGALSFG
jgi:ABC-type nitrate/sulfonate/bicarbonate transport system substrate-binding protein